MVTVGFARKRAFILGLEKGQARLEQVVSQTEKDSEIKGLQFLGSNSLACRGLLGIKNPIKTVIGAIFEESTIFGTVRTDDPFDAGYRGWESPPQFFSF